MYSPATRRTFLPIFDRAANGIFGKHAAMNLDWRQAEFFDDLRVANRQCLVDGLAFDPLGGERGTCDRGSTTEALELRIFDDPLFADFDLQLHNVAALWSADDADTDIFAYGDFLGSTKCADVSWVFVMFDNFIAVCHVFAFCS